MEETSYSYTRYNDGSADLKVYPSIIRLASSKLYQDLDGDGPIDRIRINGPEWQYTNHGHLLTRHLWIAFLWIGAAVG
jgi:hypothetical protein